MREFIEKKKNGFDKETVRSRISKINNLIERSLGGGPLSHPYVIDRIRRWADTRYGVRIEKGKIEIV